MRKNIKLSIILVLVCFFWMVIFAFLANSIENNTVRLSLCFVNGFITGYVGINIFYKYKEEIK